MRSPHSAALNWPRCDTSPFHTRSPTLPLSLLLFPRSTRAHLLRSSAHSACDNRLSHLSAGPTLIVVSTQNASAVQAEWKVGYEMKRLAASRMNARVGITNRTILANVETCGKPTDCGECGVKRWDPNKRKETLDISSISVHSQIGEALPPGAGQHRRERPAQRPRLRRLLPEGTFQRSRRSSSASPSSPRCPPPS